MAKTDLSALSVEDLLVKEDQEGFKCKFPYMGNETKMVRVFAVMDRCDPSYKRVVRIVSVLDDLTGEPIEYDEGAIRFAVGRSYAWRHLELPRTSESQGAACDDSDSDGEPRFSEKLRKRYRHGEPRFSEKLRKRYRHRKH